MVRLINRHENFGKNALRRRSLGAHGDLPLNARLIAERPPPLRRGVARARGRPRLEDDVDADDGASR